MPTIDLVIFDCDGVLVDSEPVAQRILVAHLKPIVAEQAEGIASRCVGRSYHDIQGFVENACERKLGTTFWSELQIETLRELEASLAPDLALRHLLLSLPVPFCVASSGTHDKIKRVLRAVDVYDLFHGQVFSAEDVVLGKPAPDLFLHAAAHNHVPPGRCLVIEDSEPGLQAGDAAGMQVLHLNANRAASSSFAQIHQLSELRQRFSTF